MRKAKKTKVDLLIEVLQDGKWHLGDELGDKLGNHFNDAIRKARLQGFKVETKLVGIGHKRHYRLLTV